MAEPEHWLDGVADDLQDWMHTEIDYHVEAMRGGYRSPFSADVSPKELHDYWTRQMYVETPDGVVHYDQPNQKGRDTLLQEKGVKTYAEVYEATKPKTSKGIRPVLDTPDTTNPTIAPIPQMPEDTNPVEPGP